MKATKLSLAVIVLGLSALSGEANSAGPACAQWVKPNFGPKYCAQVISMGGTSGAPMTTTSDPVNTAPGNSGNSNGNSGGGNGRGPSR
jgi:hypothetical protein